MLVFIVEIADSEGALGARGRFSSSCDMTARNKKQINLERAKEQQRESNVFDFTCLLIKHILSESTCDFVY